MKYLFIFFATLTIQTSFAQEKIEYKVDSNVSIEVSEYYEVHDTLGVTVVVSGFNSNKMTIIKKLLSGEDSIEIKNSRELLKAYKGMIEGAIEQSHGKLLEKKIIEQSNLKLIAFVYQTRMKDGIFNIENVGFFLNNNMYLIQIYKPENDIYSVNEIIGLLKFNNNLSEKNQITL